MNPPSALTRKFLRTIAERRHYTHFIGLDNGAKISVTAKEYKQLYALRAVYGVSFASLLTEQKFIQP